MKFKDIIAGASILCLASVVSCNKDMDGNLSESGKIVSLSVNSAQTDISKTWVNAAIGESVLPVYWSNGDMIAVNGIASNALELDPGEKASSAVFKVRNVSTPYYVLYPASGMESIDEDYRMKVIIPGEQNYVEDSFDNGSAVMCAYAENGSEPVSLKNCCGAICVMLKDEGNTAITSLTLNSLGETQICGEYSLDVENAVLVPVSGGKSISMVFPDGSTELTPEGKRFIFAIPAGEYPAGFSLKFIDERKHVLRCFWLRKAAEEEAGVEVKAGTMVMFEAREYQPDAREITCAQDWEDFAAAYNAGSWEEDWLGKDGSVKITEDFTSEKLSKITNFSAILDGCGHTVTQTAGVSPLIGTLSGTVRNLTFAGTMTPSDPATAGAVVLATNMVGDASIENCVNKMDIILTTTKKSVIAAFVRTMNGGNITNCVNDGTINAAIDINSQDQPILAGGFVSTISLDSPASIVDCENNADITVTLVRDAGSSKRPVQAGYGGIVGTYIKGQGNNFLTLERCVNNGQIKVGYSAAPTQTAEFISGVGGIIGCALTFIASGTTPWFKTGRPTESELTSEDCVYMVMKDCVNNGDIYSDLISSCSSDNVTKACAGGLAGVLNGRSDQHIEIIGCESYGKVIPHEQKYSRSALCTAAGGLTGYGAYVDFKNCTLKSEQIGTSKRQSYSVGGVIGFAVAAFNIESCNIFANLQFIRCTTYTPSNYAIGFTLSTQVNTDGGLYPTFIMIDGSSVTNSRFGGTIAYNSSTITYNANSAPKLDKTETITASTVDVRIPSGSFGYNTSYLSKVTISNNSYWNGN